MKGRPYAYDFCAVATIRPHETLEVPGSIGGKVDLFFNVLGEASRPGLVAAEPSEPKGYICELDSGAVGTAHPEQCVTGGGGGFPEARQAKAGEPCVFPFTYHGEQFFECTSMDFALEWCMTGDGKMGACDCRPRQCCGSDPRCSAIAQGETCSALPGCEWSALCNSDNVAEGKPVTVTGAKSRPNNGPSFLTDGCQANCPNHWSTNPVFNYGNQNQHQGQGQGDVVTITIDLGATYCVGAVKVFWMATHLPGALAAFVGQGDPSA